MAQSYTVEPKPEKIQSVERLREIVEASSTAILTDQTGLNVKQMSEMRKRLEAVGASLTVVKNTLFRLATAGTPMAPLGEGLEGPTALAYSAGEPAAVAKAIATFIREARVGAVKRGFVEGSLLAPDEVNDLATLPPREVLVAQVVGSLVSPMSSLLGVMQMVLANFAFTLHSVAEKREAA